MKRFHVHLNVADLAQSIRFYSALFAAEPSVNKPDYAKWLLDDPRINFAISSTGRAAGVDHLGIQADSGEALAELGRRLDAAGNAVVPEAAAVCCYAQSDKYWTEDPQGTRWETFHTTGQATHYYAGAAACVTSAGHCSPHDRTVAAARTATDTCCAPQSGCC